MNDKRHLAFRRPAGAPRLDRDGNDLDARAAEENRVLEEDQQESRELPPEGEAIRTVLDVVEARRRARLAAGCLERILGGEYTDDLDALTKIQTARALLAGAAKMLAIYDKDESNG